MEEEVGQLKRGFQGGAAGLLGSLTSGMEHVDTVPTFSISLSARVLGEYVKLFCSLKYVYARSSLLAAREGWGVGDILYWENSFLIFSSYDLIEGISLASKPSTQSQVYSLSQSHLGNI